MSQKLSIIDNESSVNRDIRCARDTISLEIEGLQALKDWFGDDFASAINLIAKIKGRVVLSGMGKSGHVARKIAATLASTGTKAIFVHPAEASHGDLGMIGKEDVIILLSNSGETAELKDIIHYAKRFSIPLIGIVRRKTSILVKSSDVALILPEVPEASTVGAPTTSTTMMIALGDAMAVTLLERRGFKKEDFGVFHPGGKLGSAFIKVKDIMHVEDKLPVINENSLMSDVLIEMTAKHFGCTAVVDSEGFLKGIITDGDLRRHMDSNITYKSASDIMTKNPVTIEAENLATKALSIMEEKSITSLFILDNKIPKGIIHIHDLLRNGVA